MTARRQTGAAVVAVLIVVAIIAGIGATVVVDQQYSLRRTASLLHGNQATMHLLALETWGKEVLIDDRKQGSAEDSLEEDWARELPPVSADGGIVSGKIEDLQARFNINSIFAGGSLNPYAYNIFVCLLTRHGSSGASPAHIADAVVDWLDGDQQSHNNNGAEDLDYLSQDPPYRTAARPMASPSELMLIDGMTADTYEALLPYITALPVQVQVQEGGSGNALNFNINVNTASQELLDCVGDPQNPTPVGSILKQEIESSGPFTSQSDVHNSIQGLLNIEQQNFNAAQWPLDVKSDYFLLSTRAEFGEMTLLMQHVVQRDSTTASVLMRSFGAQW